MSSAICKNFVQNAWKKELCSNCFKSKDEHAPPPKLKSLTLVSNGHITGIIKDPKKTKPKQNVEFTKELTEFIGYGGEDWLSGEEADNEQTYETTDLSEDDLLLTDSDEEDHIREIRRQTKKNTNYNTVSLREVIEEKKTYAHLMLGKPLVDSEGKKQTLLVSVTPFGEDTPKKSCTSNITVQQTSSLYKIKKETSILKKETKNTCVLTSQSNKNEEDCPKAEMEEKSLLDEISETLEKGSNPIHIVSKRNTPIRDIELSAKDSNKENINTHRKEETKAENKSDKKVSLTRTPALKGRDLEKPTIYQTTTAKIDILNSKNIKMNKESSALGTSMCKSEINNNSNDSTLSENDKKLFNDIVTSSNFIRKEIENSSVQMANTKPPKEEIDNLKKKSNKSAYDMPPLISKYNLSLPQSREQAGKPDGREDPEAPELPLTPPPPLENQNSFLYSHANTSSTNHSTFTTSNISNHPPSHEKPKIPSKPATVLIRKPINLQSVNQIVQSQQMTTFSKEPLSKQDSGSDIESRVNKRRAPQPPEETNNNSPLPFHASAIYTRNSTSSTNSDSPVVREKEKRERNERASSCTPKMYVVNGSSSEESHDYETPAPAPRKSISISTDNLLYTPDDKRKDKSKGRFSLRKFLRMGSSKDLPRLSVEANIDLSSDQPKPKPRLVIVHPSELNGSKVEVVAKADQIDSPRIENAERPPSLKASKPPPPPRNYDNWKPPVTSPPPPKSVEILNKQRALSRSSSNSSTNNSKSETVYANIGEVRSAIVPNKPVRTASMREREAQQQKQMQQKKNHYEPIGVGNSRMKTDHVYDYINGSDNRSSSPGSDSSGGKNSPKTKVKRLNKRSESSIDVSGEYFKYGNIPRSMSLTYCGSETESEIYAPYTFCGGSESEVNEDDHDWIQNGRTHKLRSRKGRSIVHKNLEDNYGAVVVANHEALAQVLENIQQTVFIQPALRGLKMCSNLRMTDFSMKSGIPPIKIGSKTFHQALWGAQHVTLMFSTGISTSSTLNLGTFNLHSVTDFSDLVPCDYLPNEKQNGKQVQATISVLPWLQIHTIESYSESVKIKSTQDDNWKDSFFILLQLVNALKMLQAQGIEELPLALTSFVLCKDMDKDAHHRLCIIQGSLPSEITTFTSREEKYGTLCMCAGKAVTLLQPPSKTTTLIQSLLNNERSVSLTQVKAILEFSLWGPSDVSLGSTVRERELTLQRWLDLQRATVLHGLVCARVQLTVYEECHLLFLVRSNARMMSDASMLIESNNHKYSHSSKA